MAGLNVFTRMMIEAIMYVGIGLLLGCLIAVAVTPLVHNRAVRLTTRRLETVLPQSMEEIQAGKDLLRAEFAMYARRLELINEWQKNKITSQLVELSKKSDVINWLKRDRDRLRMQVEAPKQQLAAALDTGQGWKVTANGARECFTDTSRVKQRPIERAVGEFSRAQ